jgi:phosphatidate cytidylyltransferase
MRQRVVTALLLAIPALLALALRAPWPLATLGLLAVIVGGTEADRILKTRLPICTVVAVLGYAPLAWAFPLYDVKYGLPTLFLVAATCFGVSSAAFPERLGLDPFGRVLAGLWIAAPLLAVLLLHNRGSATHEGTWMLSPALMALAPVWAGDIAAIFAGKAFGKHPLAPSISPKKTVEGSVANLLAAILVAWLLGRLLHLDDVRSLGAGLAVGILGQAGDLFESWLKRRAGVKDSGTLLPGHGGVLDRIDSVLFAAPAVALILLN